MDLSIYYPITLLSTEGYVSMAKDLLAVTPSKPPPHVQLAVKALMQVVAEVKDGLVARIDEDLGTGLERSFDAFVDRVWFEVRSRLEFYALYKHDGLQKLGEDELASIDLDSMTERSRIAANIHARLFGDGMDFLRGRYPQQATQMAARLEWLAHKQLDDELELLVTPELANLLRVCQGRYERMITERSARDGKSTADLRELRNKLRVQIYAYCGAVGSMVDPNVPASAKQVEAALRPLLSYRAQNRRRGGGDEAVEPDADSVEPSSEPGMDAGGQDEGQGEPSESGDSAAAE